ncbi:carboxypeptidase regulatory-like domain-containing protein [Mastigocoleus testarum]|uniref:Carboxypeptidase regulatory-like domain-containing protein n=1 Tax=Mastigocoleus testarum BC008 TaxID=371196 RepID=A0A0V7ZJQ1_9CYAN|nr:carboxypeptidase regulatory-like domain-containing protein [Mastigocoleus testarum]KST62206.1 hypothetical protein BC008_37820 [Mastigocoleus testarum BC008]KST64836.1 hypothetical protein BC008_18650 [Mastigocoleus testarum BC008]
MLRWERIRHRVAIAGQVTDAQTNKAIAGVEVAITKGPEAFMGWLRIRASQYGDEWEKMLERPDRTRTAYDGHFHFLDLPEGEYRLHAFFHNASRRYGTAFLDLRVSQAPEDENIITVADLTLTPTCLKGQILDDDDDPIVLAEVRLKYSQESTFSNQEGQYLLNAIEAAEKFERTIIISAQGYQTTSQTVVFNEAGIEENLNFILTKKSNNL